ncbi:MAG: 2-vinyl bacteriochlorophyllide hydratase [Hyphomonas sp.]|uniref:2-vinyl bacteriochlorophyllide hydratase n=1 Tax=Hyphomonas sp. TaxID=87 RepID=UPI0034A0251A
MNNQPVTANRRKPLYTAEQRARRDASRWTLAQAVLAPLQFFVFAVSLFLVVRYLLTGNGLDIATASIVLKTFILYAIMITGAIWEKDVFGKYLFADAFFWEDAVSMIVIALHTAYLVMLLGNIGSPVAQITVALAGYAAYVINAVQFLWKLRLARLEPIGAQGVAA